MEILGIRITPGTIAWVVFAATVHAWLFPVFKSNPDTAEAMDCMVVEAATDSQYLVVHTTKDEYFYCRAVWKCWVMGPYGDKWRPTMMYQMVGYSETAEVDAVHSSELSKCLMGVEMDWIRPVQGGAE